MSSDKETISFYDGAAAKYAGKFVSNTPDDDLVAFMDAVKPGGRIWDLGCGPGNSAHMMIEAGFVVQASDASQSMADLAQEKYGLDVRVETFDAISDSNGFDGIWANFSLLHTPRAHLPHHLAAIRNALVQGGVFHLGLKLGDGEERDHLGRFYAYHSETELRAHLAEAGFSDLVVRTGESKGMAGTLDPYVIIRAHA